VEAPGEGLTAGTHAARAQARSTAYGLFARLFRREVTPDLRPVLAGISDLGDALPSPFDADEVAAEHHRLFALQVPPWAGVLEDPEGRIGGEAAARVRDLYRRAGLELDERSEEADHLSHTLDLLADVGARPALAREILDRALLPWLPWLAEAIERHGGPFHRMLAGLTLELALDHRAELGGAPAAPSTPSIEDPLADPRAGLARVARFLVTPARSGLYLARDDVRALGAGGSLPTGFGGRADELETLLRAAAELGGFERVIDGLAALVDAGRAACAALERAGGSAVTAPVALRRARLDRTADVLARLRDAVDPVA
jgi:TorA maturation chaperone TorD